MPQTAMVILGGPIVYDSGYQRWRSTIYSDEPDEAGHVTCNMIRVIAANILHKATRDSIIIASGNRGYLHAVPGSPTIASVMREELIRMGARSANIFAEDRSDNTYQNVLYTLRFITGNWPDVSAITFVSELWHLPRVRAFIAHRPEITEACAQFSAVRTICAEYVVTSDPICRSYWLPAIEEQFRRGAISKNYELGLQGIRQLKDGTYNLVPVNERSQSKV